MMNPSVLPLSTQVPLTDATFKEATWDYVQNKAMATDKWGDIVDWDVSDIKDFSFAFSQIRDETGGSACDKIKSATGCNPKAASFNGDISKWDTSSVTTLDRTFNGASAMNSNIGSFDVSKVGARA